jgi:hypothetical protein
MRQTASAPQSSRYLRSETNGTLAKLSRAQVVCSIAVCASDMQERVAISRLAAAPFRWHSGQRPHLSQRYATMSEAAVNALRIVLGSIEAAKVRGIVLFILAALAGYGLYSAMVPDDDLNRASADAVTIPPLVRAEPMSSPPAALRVIRETAGRPVAMPARPVDRASLVRDLQIAMTRTECYHGPINGVWTVASKEAMSAFLVAVNAQLPVDNPDQTLLALAQSNSAAKCAPGHADSNGAASPPAPPTSDRLGASQIRADATPSVSPTNFDGAQAPLNDRPTSERAWAPAEMLVPAKPTAQSSGTAVTLAAGSAAPVLQPETSPSAESQVIRDESGQTKAQLEPAKVSRPRAKSRRHKTSDYDDVSKSISKGLNSIQRSLSSVFD